MRILLIVIAYLGLAMSLHAEDFVYISMAPEQKIGIHRVDSKDGKLTLIETIAVDGTPGLLSVDPKTKFLFASLRSTSKLASFRIDPATGKLTLISTAPLGKAENAAYVGTDRSGKWLLSASYMGGKVVVHALKDGAIVTPPVQTIATVMTAHATVTDANNRFVFVPHVTPNAIYQFKLDEATGKLTDAGKAPGGAKKAGPRHLAFHPDLNLAYSSDEVGNSITAYRYSPSGLAPEQTLSTLPADFKKGNTTAEVKVHPSGRFVWVSNRGHDSLAGFAIDLDGKLTAIGHTPTEPTPRSFDISADGRFAYGAGEGNGKLAVYAIDAASGKMTRLHTYEVGKSLPCLLAVRLGGKQTFVIPVGRSQVISMASKEVIRRVENPGPKVVHVNAITAATKKILCDGVGPGRVIITLTDDSNRIEEIEIIVEAAKK